MSHFDVFHFLLLFRLIRLLSGLDSMKRFTDIFSLSLLPPPCSDAARKYVNMFLYPFSCKSTRAVLPLSYRNHSKLGSPFFDFSLSYVSIFSMHQSRFHCLPVPPSSIPNCLHKVSLCLWVWCFLQRLRWRSSSWT